MLDTLGQPFASADMPVEPPARNLRLARSRRDEPFQNPSNRTSSAPLPQFVLLVAAAGIHLSAAVTNRARMARSREAPPLTGRDSETEAFVSETEAFVEVARHGVDR